MKLFVMYRIYALMFILEEPEFAQEHSTCQNTSSLSV